MSRFHDEFFGKKDSKHDKLLIKCVSKAGIEKILSRFDAQKAALEFVDQRCPQSQIYTSFETEVICKSRNHRSEFILGYADIVITVGDEENVSICSNPFVQILVEVKPELSDVGATLRQIKTYEDSLRRAPRFFKAIVTYSKIDPDVVEYLDHEHVKVIVFEESA